MPECTRFFSKRGCALPRRSDQSPSTAKCRGFWTNRSEPLEAGEVTGVRFPDPGASASGKRIGVRWMSVLGQEPPVAGHWSGLLVYDRF